MKNNTFKVTLRPEGEKIETLVQFSRESHYGCVDGMLDKTVLVAYLTDTQASNYVVSKKEGERMTVFIKELKVVVTGIVMTCDDLLHILITNVFPDAYEIESKWQDLQQI